MVLSLLLNLLHFRNLVLRNGFLVFIGTSGHDDFYLLVGLGKTHVEDLEAFLDHLLFGDHKFLLLDLKEMQVESCKFVQTFHKFSHFLLPLDQAYVHREEYKRSILWKRLCESVYLISLQDFSTLWAPNFLALLIQF